MRMFKVNSQEIKRAKIPLIVWLVTISTFVAGSWDIGFLGRSITGWAWVIPVIISIIIVLQRKSNLAFPVHIWLLWIIMVVGYFIKSEFSYLQRSLLLICPMIIGMAVSSYQIREAQLKGFFEIMRLLIILLFLTITVRTGMLFTGVLPAVTGLAAQSMTAALLCSFFAVEYSINRRRSLLQWIIGATIPVMALTRMAILAAGVTIPFTFASLKIKKRLIFLTIVIIVGVAFFYTERLQKKMFYSGRGRIEDVRLGNPDFFTAGRSHLWDHMIDEIKVKPVWGHGANASEEFVLSVTWGTLTHPHNDWLRLLYDYGFVGVSIFVICIVMQVAHLLKRGPRTFGETRVLLYAGASSFLPFVLLMFTDNIILYAAFFGNLQFTIIGLVYAAQRTQEIDAWYYYHTPQANVRPNFSYPHNRFSNQQDHHSRT